jgi:long-chain acyl-CoA synthetase
MRLSRLTWRFDISGLENLPADGKYILCPNHQSYLDSLWIWAAIGHKRVDLRKITCLAAEVFLPSKFMLAMLGGIPVERNGNTIPAMKRGLACIEQGNTMLIHPEGTRTRDGKMHDFKGGAAKLAIDAAVPVIPVRIDGAWDIFPPNKKRPKIFRFGGRYPISISFGEPIAPGGKSVEDLTAQIQSAVEQLEKQDRTSGQVGRSQRKNEERSL